MIPAHRSKMKPALLEALMMLLINEEWWPLEFFEEVYNGQWDQYMNEDGNTFEFDEKDDKKTKDERREIDIAKYDDMFGVQDGKADYEAVMNEAHGDDPDALYLNTLDFLRLG